MKNSLELAKKVRIHCLNMTNHAKSSHIGSMLSVVDILAVLYKNVLNIDPLNPKKQDRDRVILSKGHAGAALYAVLAECGFFPIEELNTYCDNGSRLSGHVSHYVPGVEVSTGSLGHGLSIGAGIAYLGNLEKKKYKVYVILGDGECDEGMVWEAAMFSSHHQLNNLIAIVDYNKLQSLGTVNDILKLEPFRMKWESFGWKVIEVDGHNHSELSTALELTKNDDIELQPKCIIAHTIKGKGVSFMENTVLWHYRSPQNEEYLSAKKELDNSI
jgi:transketolase